MNEKLLKLLDRLDRKLLENHRFETALFERLSAAQKRTGIMHDERPICPFLRPHFIPRSQYARIARAAEILHAAFESMTAAALEDETLMAELGLTEREEAMARIEPGYWRLCVSSRFDAYLAGDDFKFLEYNAETPAGVGDQIPLSEIFAEVAEVGEFLAEHPHYRPRPHVRLLEALVAAYRETGGRKMRPNIAIVDWRGVSTAAEFVILRDYFESEGCPTIVADPEELEYDGRSLRVGDFIVDIFYKRVIIHEFLERYDETHPLIRAYRDGNVCMANSFRVKMAHKKTSFAVLTDEKYAALFTAEQQSAIGRHLPWTRRVRDGRATYAGREVALLELLRRDRERFILKPHDDYGGHGIVPGWETSAGDWDAALENALAHCFVAQERAAVEKISMPAFGDRGLAVRPLNVDFDPFLFAGKVEGGLVRLADQSLVNVTQGGGETALVVLEDF
jgi:hypothetical protein